MIFDYWNKKSPREKIFIAFGAIFLLFFLLYLLIWSPLHSKKVDLYNSVQEQKDLLAWMELQAPTIKALRNDKGLSDSREVFSIIEDLFKHQNSEQNKLAIVRISENKASINFTNVSFDEFITQLGLLKKNFNINVDEIQINKSDKPGLVSGTVILTK